MEKLMSVIILNWDGEDYIGACLDSVIVQDYHPLEIIVVDNGSSDSSVELVKSKYGQVKLIENDTNLGFAEGNNIGIREARGEYVVLLNNDAELAPACLSEMRRAIDKSPIYGACASKIYLKFEENLLDAAGIAVCPDGLSIGRGRLENGDFYDKEEEVFFASGCCMMCRREMLEDVKVGDQYFDESFFMYADDTDLGWRARLRGWKTIYAPSAQVYHLHSASSESYSALKAFLVERNRIWIQMKYFPLQLILCAQFFTFARYFFQAWGVFTRRGAAGEFVKEHSRLELLTVLLRAYRSASKGLPGIWRERGRIRKRRQIAVRDIFQLLRLYGIGAKRISFKA